MVQKKIGSGSFGSVFQVTDLFTNNEYAMKIEKAENEFDIYNK